MLNLEVDLDTTVVDSLLNGQNATELTSEWGRYAEYLDLGSRAEAVLAENDVNPQNLSAIDGTVRYLQDNLHDAVAHITEYFPSTSEHIDHTLRVVLLPFGNFNYGPRPGVQVFSVLPKANPFEAYLFLIHIFYHEVCFLFETTGGREAQANPKDLENYKYCLRLLVRNEGIANYAVLEALKELLSNIDDDYEFCYFIYARSLQSPAFVEGCFRVLYDTFDDLNDQNFLSNIRKVDSIVTSKELSLINILGTYATTKIAEVHGLRAATDVFRKDPDVFFGLFMRTGDPMTKYCPPILPS